MSCLLFTSKLFECGKDKRQTMFWTKLNPTRRCSHATRLFSSRPVKVPLMVSYFSARYLVEMCFELTSAQGFANAGCSPAIEMEPFTKRNSLGNCLTCQYPSHQIKTMQSHHGVGIIFGIQQQFCLDLKDLSVDDSFSIRANSRVICEFSRFQHQCLWILPNNKMLINCTFPS